MTISFHGMKVEDGLVTGRQLPDQLGQLLGAQDDFRVIIRHRMKGSVRKKKVRLVPAMLLEIVDGCIDHDPADPATQLSRKGELMQIPEYHNKTLLQHIFRIHKGFGVAITDAKHRPCEMLIELLLS